MVCFLNHYNKGPLWGSILCFFQVQVRPKKWHMVKKTFKDRIE